MKKYEKKVRETNWGECIFNKTARKITPDIGRARFLLKTSSERINYLEKQEVLDPSANFIFESYYSSIIELLQAISLFDGYNIINHLCLGYYLRDIIDKSVLFRIFDSCRYKRNSLVYYGKIMEFEIAKASIQEIKKLASELKIIFEDKLLNKR